MNGNITIKEQLYKIQKVENKRIYNYMNNKLVSTSPIKLPPIIKHNLSGRVSPF